MTAKRKASKPKEMYQLVRVWGCVEPSLVGRPAKTWEAFEEQIQKFLKTSDYNEEKDGLHFLKLDGEGRLKSACSFSGGFMYEMKMKANAGLQIPE